LGAADAVRFAESSSRAGRAAAADEFDGRFGLASGDFELDGQHLNQKESQKGEVSRITITGIGALLIAAGHTGDNRFIPVMKKLSSYDYSGELWKLENREYFPNFP
jgi:hypothetical protein